MILRTISDFLIVTLPQPRHLLRLRVWGGRQSGLRTDPRLQWFRHWQLGARPWAAERRSGGHGDQQRHWRLQLPLLSPGQLHLQQDQQSGQASLGGGGLRVHLPGRSRAGWPGRVLKSSKPIFLTGAIVIVRVFLNENENPFWCLRNTKHKTPLKIIYDLHPLCTI